MKNTMTFDEYWKAQGPEIRYGQAFCNYYKLQNQSLFYETNEERARELIEKYSKDWQLV